jgi:probable HAF family extracellular repeat protein
MKSKFPKYILAMILASATAVGGPLAAQNQGHGLPHYRIVQLGSLGGTVSSGVTINNIGWAMGSSNPAANTSQEATLWAYGLTIPLGTLGGPNSTVDWPNRNDSGVIVGTSETATKDPLGESFSCPAVFALPSGNSCVGFVWQNFRMKQLPTLGGNNAIGAGINAEGLAVGWAENNVADSTCLAPQVLQFEAVVWGPDYSKILQLPSLSGDPDGAATAINGQGQIVGISGTCDVAIGAYSAKHAVIWENGQPTEIKLFNGSGWNTPMAINNLGVVAGFANVPPDVVGGQLQITWTSFIWSTEGGATNIGVLNGDAISEATGINDEGTVIGTSFAANFTSSRAYLYKDGQLEDLNNLALGGSNLYLISTGDINNSGVITGQACVLINGACTSQSALVAFVGFPVSDEKSESRSAQGHANAARVLLPENIRQIIMRQHGLLPVSYPESQ